MMRDSRWLPGCKPGSQSIYIHPNHAIGHNINWVHFRPVSHSNIIDGTVTKASTFIYLDVLNTTQGTALSFAATCPVGQVSRPQR